MNHRTGIDRRRALVATAALLGAARCGDAAAQAAAFPTRPIRIIVPFPPGSGTDISARFFGARIAELAGQPVFVENHPGGNGFIGVNAVLSAPADGHTVFAGGTSSFTTNLVAFKTLPYDPIRDFTPLGMLMRSPSVMVVSRDSGLESLQAMVARARAAPGRLTSGTGAISYQLAAGAFYQRAGIQVTNIPFKGASDVVTAAASNVVDVAVVDIGSALPLVRGGRLRALAQSSALRFAELPDVPTYIEAGYPGYTTFNWSGAAVSARTPDAVVAQLGGWFAKVAEMPATREAFRQLASEPVPGGAAEMRRIVQAEIERWRSIASIAGVEPQ